MVAQPQRYLIVGAGIGGLAAALAMSRIGLPVTLLERVARPADVGAGIALHPNGLAVLYGLGLRERLQHRAHLARHGSIAIGDRRRTIPLPDYGAGLDHALALTRARLYSVLHEAVGHTDVDARFGHEVLGADPDGHVEVRAPDGSTYDLHARLVIGADGIGSVVRANGDFGAQRLRTPSLTARALVTGTPFGDGQIERWSAHGIAVGSPMGDGTSYLALSSSRGAAKTAMADGDLPALRHCAATMLPGADLALRTLGGFDELLITPVDTVTCTSWYDNRLVLLGDAAHAMTPHLGQGANSALLDAYVLAEELSRDQPRRAALGLYASRRQHAVSRVQRLTRVYERISERWTVPGVRHARDAIAAAGIALAARGPSPVNGVVQEDPAAVYTAVRHLTRPVVGR